MLGAGWLRPAETELDYVGAYRVNRTKFPTRFEEFTWVRQSLMGLGGPWTLLDAATGFNPEIHFLSNILADDGHNVFATDLNPATMEMPGHPRIKRLVEDIRHSSSPDEVVDCWVCISVLEHMPPEAQIECLQEAYRQLKPGGFLLLTLDEEAPSSITRKVASVGFLTGDAVDESKAKLPTPVTYLIAQKPCASSPPSSPETKPTDTSPAS